MLDEAIVTFLSERKATKLKGVSDSEQIQKIEETFYPENWLPDAAKRAGQLSLVSHPSKFTHPSAKTSSLIFDGNKFADGFLRTGNVNVGLDASGNAGAMDVYKFLSLELADGKTVLKHLEENTDYIQQQFKFPSVSFDELRDNFLAIKQDKSSKIRTSGQVKQVYFPVEDDYHLLSVLTPSGLMFALKEKIQSIRFSEQTESARNAKKNNAFDEHGFDELYDLAVIGFGGKTKKGQNNISVLNSKYSGTAYLLSSIPPSLKIRNFQIPTTDFFKNCIYPKLYKDSFYQFDYWINSKFDDGIKKYVDRFTQKEKQREIINLVIDDVITTYVWQLRELNAGWSEKTTLPMYQRIWLDNAFLKERENTDDWLNQVIKNLASWFMKGYKKVVQDFEVLGGEEFFHIRTIIEENSDGLL